MKGFVYFPVVTTIALIAVQMFKPAPQKKDLFFEPKQVLATPSDTDSLAFPFHDDPYYSPEDINHPLYLSDPKNIKDTVEFDSETGEYVFKRQMGNIDYRPTFRMSRDEYLQYDFDKAIRDYWQERAMASGKKK